MVAIGLWFSAGVVTDEENLPNDKHVSSPPWQEIRDSLFASFTMEEEMRRIIKGDVVSKHFNTTNMGVTQLKSLLLYVYKK